MIASVAASAPAVPPDTGASRCSIPRASSRAAMSRVATGEMVAMSTTIVPGCAPSTMPFAPSATASLSALAMTMVKTTSASAATSAGEPQARAPASTCGCIASGRRAHTASGCPARRRCSAIGRPMAPRPIQPTRRSDTRRRGVTCS